MIKFLGSRGASAVMGIFMLAMGSSATAQSAGPLDVPAAVRALDADTSATPFEPAAQDVTRVLASRRLRRRPRWQRLSGSVLQTQPARSVTVSLSQSIATEAAWLYRAGWPLYALVDRYRTGAPLDEQGTCLATAVYFEARGESVEGQLAVARVVMNRAPRVGIRPIGAASSSSPRNSRSSGTASFHGSTPARPPGRVPRASPGWRWQMSSQALAVTCCGITPIT